jgi:hypothetical protein
LLNGVRPLGLLFDQALANHHLAGSPDTEDADGPRATSVQGQRTVVAGRGQHQDLITHGHAHELDELSILLGPEEIRTSEFGSVGRIAQNVLTNMPTLFSGVGPLLDAHLLAE